MNRKIAFVRSSAFGAAVMLGLLMCCPVALAGGPIDDNQNTVTPVTPTTVKKVKTEPPPKPTKPYQPPAPETLDIGQGLSNGLGLTGAIDFTSYGKGIGSAELTQSAWGKQVIKQITQFSVSSGKAGAPLSPSKDELARFGTKEDLTAGEALDDDTWPSPLPVQSPLKNASVVLEVPISWTGSGNGFVSEVFGSYWDGDTGVYAARPEVCLAASDHTELRQVKDEDGKPIGCKNADGVLHRDGYWYDLADPWSSVAYLSLDSEARYGIPGLPKKTITGKLFHPR